jgi:O-antigen ligase
MSTFLLGIYIALIFIRPMEWWEPVLNFQLVTAAALGTLGTAFPRLLKDWPRYWKAVPELRVAFFMLIGVTCSWMWPIWLSGISDAFQIFGKVFILYALIVILSQKQGSFRILLWSVLLCTGWMALHGVIMGRAAIELHDSAHGFGPAVPRWRPSRLVEGQGVYQIVAYGLFEDPNDLCLVFVIALPLLFAEIKANSNPIARFTAMAMIPLNLYAAYFTNSRGGLVGIFGMSAAYIIGRLQGFKRWFMIVFTVGLITVGAPARGGELGIIDKDRLTYWGDGLDAWKHSPIFGVGFGNFRSITEAEGAAHNSYVNALTELGLLGYIPFMVLLFLTATHMRRAAQLKTRISASDQAYLVGLYSALIGYLTSIYFLSRTYNHVLYIILGLGIGKVVMACHDEETFMAVFGTPKADMKRALYFAFGSIPFIWGTIRLGRALGG